jgi:signal peptidase I
MPSKCSSADVSLTIRRVTGFTLVIVALSMGALFGIAGVSGSSMRPALEPGDLAIYRRGEAISGPGAVVAFDSDGLIIHRVVVVEDSGALRTRGDANAQDDIEVVGRDSLRGEVVAVLPLGGVAERVVAFLDRW